VVRAIAFHLCDPGLISARVACELSLFDVLFFLMPPGFFSRFSSFPPSSKINTVSRVGVRGGRTVIGAQLCGILLGFAQKKIKLN